MTMKVLAVGSCRLLKPSRVNKWSAYPVTVYSSGEVLQALHIINREDKAHTKISSRIRKYIVGKGASKKIRRNFYNKKITTDSFDAFVIEISSFQNHFLKKVKTKLICGQVAFALKERRKIITSLETEKQINDNLDLIWEKINNKNMIVVSHNNVLDFDSRTNLANILKRWCDKNNQTYVDPTDIIIGERVENCFIPYHKKQEKRYNCNGFDINHYAKPMVKVMADHLHSILLKM